MPNPVEKIVALVKKGDRRVILGGAAVIGGGVGLIVFLHSRNSGGTVTAKADQTAGVPEGGGGGGGGTSGSLLGDLGATGTAGAGDFGVGEDNSGLSLPVLPDLTPVPLMAAPVSAANFADTSPIPLPELASYSTNPFMASLPSLPTLEPLSYSGDSYGGYSALPGIGGSTGGKFDTLVPTQPVTQPTLTPTDIAPILEAKPAPKTTTATQTQIDQFLNSQVLAQQARAQYLAQEEQKKSLAAYGAARQSVSDALAQQAILKSYTQAAQSQLQSYGAARQSVSNALAALPKSNLQVYQPAPISNLAVYGQVRQSVSNALAQQGILQQYQPPMVSNLQSYGAVRQSVSNYYAQQGILNQYQPQQVQQQQSYATARQSVSDYLNKPKPLAATPVAQQQSRL